MNDQKTHSSGKCLILLLNFIRIIYTWCVPLTPCCCIYKQAIAAAAAAAACDVCYPSKKKTQISKQAVKATCFDNQAYAA